MTPITETIHGFFGDNPIGLDLIYLILNMANTPAVTCYAVDTGFHMLCFGFENLNLHIHVAHGTAFRIPVKNVIFLLGWYRIIYIRRTRT